MDNKGTLELDNKGSSSKRKNILQDEQDSKPHHKSSRERDEAYHAAPQPAAAPASPKDEDLGSGSFDAPLYRGIPSPKPASNSSSSTTAAAAFSLGHELPDDDLPLAGLDSLPLTRGISFAAAASVAAGPSGPAPAFSASSSSSASGLASPGLQRLVSLSKSPQQGPTTSLTSSSLALAAASSSPPSHSSSQADDLPPLPPKMLTSFARTASLHLQRAVSVSHAAPPEPSPAPELMSTSPVSSAGTGSGSRLSGLPAFAPIFASAYSSASVQSAFDDTEEELKQEEMAEELPEEAYFSQSDDDMPPPMPGLGMGHTNMHMHHQDSEMPDINPEDDDIPPIHPVLMRQAGGFFGGGGMGMAPAVPFLHMSRQISE